MNRFIDPAARALAVAVFLGAIAAAGPAYAASANPAQTAATTPARIVLAQSTSPQAAPAPTQTPRKAGRPVQSVFDRIEDRIKDLHNKLRITDAQETRWSAVAQSMRDNAKAMDDLVKARAQNAKTMSALDDLRSYEQLTETHAAGIKSFIAAFEPLYNSMSDDQKKTADAVFQHTQRHAHASKPKKQ